ncbi:MAG: DUF1326 domain-containing protein [Pyrinomonadaceae bacterium]
MNEIFAYPSSAGQKSLCRRFALSPVVLVSLLIALCAIGAAVLFAASNKSFVRYNSAAAFVPNNEWALAATGAAAKGGWAIRGELSETCTCSVPCTCNFGQGPSPHSYCHPFYSFDIREGRYGDVSLNGLHFGAADLQNGETIFIDERADQKQREALKIIAARVIDHASPEETEAKVKEISPRIRFAAVKQEYGDRHNHLMVAGLGEFAADYIMGLDDSQPLTVRNNTTWRIKDSIKAKTSVFRVKAGRDAIDTKNTNSNQGEFEYTDKTDFGSPATWACGGASACGDMSKNHHEHGTQ